MGKGIDRSPPSPCADPDRARIDLPGFLAIAAQLALLVLVIGRLDLGGDAYGRVLALCAAGFLVHAHLPVSWRLPFFLGLSWASLGLVVGAMAAAWVVGLGLSLMALAHVPAPSWGGGSEGWRTSWPVRWLPLLLAVVWLAGVRAGTWPAPWPLGVLTVVAAMFMFRMIIYLYDLRHETKPVRLSFRLAYFFMAPNVCFPLFPVVDFRTLRSTYYDTDAGRIYQQGIDWMLRGVFHLLLYRLVYHRLVLDESAVESSVDLAQFLIANILLYLRVSGLFHLIVGQLKLFGFNLPETNHRYFLATSFSDYWRRINIYWKDFMLKVVYYPLFVPLRRRGKRMALVVSTLAVFAASWGLHSYQWFWLQGTFPLRAVDAAFWGTVGLLVWVSSLRPATPRRQGGRAAGGWLPESLRQALRIAATFTVICVLWSMWTSDSIRQWAALWTGGEPVGSRLLAVVWIFGLWTLVALAAARFEGLAGAWASFRRRRGDEGRDEGGVPESLEWRHAARTVAVLAVLLLLGVPQIETRWGAQAAAWMADLGSDHLSRADAETVERGYYERLLEVRRLDTPLLERVAMSDVAPEVPLDSDLFRASDDFLRLEIVPGASGLYAGRPFSSNRWGMRDRDYSLARPLRVTRVAVLGGSHVMGHGVGDDEVFEALLEDRFKRDSGTGQGRRFEFLNFAVESYTPLHQVFLLERKILDFDPDVVLYVAHTADAVWARRHLTTLVLQRLERPYRFLDEMVVEAGVGGPEERAEFFYRKRLEPLEGELVEWAYERMAALCRERGVRPVWVFLPKLEEYGRDFMQARLERTARESGFDTIMLTGVFRTGATRRSLQVGDADYHPNAAGHQLIADRLFDELAARPELLTRLDTRNGPATTETGVDSR